MLTKLVRILFFGNIFYSLIAVALCIETNLIHGLTINHFPFYLLIFFGTWIYYTMIYVRSSAANANKDINHWYRVNMVPIRRVLFAIIILEIALAVYLLIFHFYSLHLVSVYQWLLMASVPVAGTLYTFNLPLPSLRKFRQVGWLKPFIIGITWSGWVTIYPMVVWHIQYGTQDDVVLPSGLFWLINFLFISILAIIFDVKDYHTDVRKELWTYPAKLGITSTYRTIVLPLTLITILIMVWFQVQQSYTFAQMAVQLLPFLILLFIVIKPGNRHSTLYYLVFIDGLMLLKAIAGIVSVQLL